MLAAGDVTVDALFRQAGVIRTDTTAEMLDVAALLATSPAPEGSRVGIVTNAGGPGIMCADACEAQGLQVPALSDDVRATLAERLLPEASTGNPVDLIASAPAEHYRRALEVLGATDAVDALVAIFIEPLGISLEEVAAELRAAADALTLPLPLAVVLMVDGEVPAVLRERRPLPVYPFPEDAAKALARAWERSRERAEPEGAVPALEGLRSDEAAAALSRALVGGEGWLDPAACAQVLDCYGIPLAPWRLAATVEEAAERAVELGGPVALKAVATGLVHKTDAGAVRLGLEGGGEVAAAAREMARDVAAAGAEVEAFLVQRMAEPGVEMLVGVVADSSFGPVLACGAGGTMAELLGDLAVRLPPLTDRDAHEMVRSLRSFALLRGHRGAPAADVEALEDVLLRVGALVEAHSEIAELDCNPVIVAPSGATVVDARIRVEQPVPRPLPFTR
jgi:acetate---CoA ligase (ADP-forming)